MSKHQEAFKRIMWLLKKLADWNGYDLSELDKKYNYMEDEKKVTELLEKAKPKKPDKYVLLERDSHGFPTHGYCKTCGTSLLVKNNYCGRCGQALDWSGDDE